MTSSTVVTLLTNLTSDVMGIMGSVFPVIMAAFALLLGLGFGIYLFRRYVFKKKV